MICALCKENEADKKNTHYLTDGVIRSALNIDGSNSRETGFLFDLSTNNPTIEFNFQRNTPQQSIEDVLKRPPTEEEMAKAKSIPFSVDNIFCFSCEKIFTEIEDPFLKHLLPKFRANKYFKDDSFSNDYHKIIRLFFYLQIWRSSICTNSIELSDKTLEDIRLIIINHNKVSLNDIWHYPLSITYLTTAGNQKEYTGNIVGLSNDENPFIIHLNDFAIQFFESEQLINYIEYYGLNNLSDFESYINYLDNDFVINVFSDEERLEFNTSVAVNSKMPQLEALLHDVANKMYTEMFRTPPPKGFSNEYVRRVMVNHDIRKFSIEKIYEVLRKFLDEILQAHRFNR